MTADTKTDTNANIAPDANASSRAGGAPKAATFGTPARRAVVEGTTLGTGVLLAAALLVLVNYLGAKYFVRADWTTNQIYSLSEKTRNVLAGLQKDVEVTIFMQPTEEVYDTVREVLTRYQAASPRVTVRAVDPDKNLVEAQRLVDRGVSNMNVVVFESGGDRRVVEQADLAEYDYSGIQFGEGPRMTGFKGEQRFTGAIVELVESRKPRIVFTTGHGEAGLAGAVNGRSLSQAEQLLGRDNFEIEEWASLGKPAVPEGTDLVVVAGPTQPFVEPELAVLGAYLEKGGRLLVLLDPDLQGGATAIPGRNALAVWLARWGVTVGSDIVIDPANPLPFFGAETLFTASYPASHPVTRSLREARVPVVLPLARSVAQGETPPGWEAAVLLETSAQGWGERDLDRIKVAVRKDDSDLAGPVPLAVAVAPRPAEPAADEAGPGEEAEAEAEAGAAPAAEDPSLGARLVVFGDVDWATDGQIASPGNEVLLADLVNWLAARPQMLGIAARTPEQARLDLSTGALRWIFGGVVGLMPGLAVIAGVLVFLRRRR